MGTLERIMQMKQQGISEPQIAQTLQQEGISPKEINEAFSQSKIKTELGTQTEPSIPGTEAPETMQTAQEQYTPAKPIQEIAQTEMQPSIISQPGKAEIQPSTTTAPISAGAYQPPTAPVATTETTPYYEEYAPQQPADIETINDIAEQIIEEKTESLKKQITGFTNFKNELQLEVDKINERLTRIENTFNELQVAVLGKIGEYGKDIKNIAKEMHATQDSFSKIINPLTDNIRALQQITQSNQETPEETTKSEFENYLR